MPAHPWIRSYTVWHQAVDLDHRLAVARLGCTQRLALCEPECPLCADFRELAAHTERATLCTTCLLQASQPAADASDGAAGASSSGGAASPSSALPSARSTSSADT